MNINDSSQFRGCTSCQICSAVCPVGAIEIRPDRNGFYRPTVDADKCIDCGVCVKSCYKFDKDIRLTSDFNTKRLYSAWAKDPDIVENTTSGGIADLLARRLIANGYVCIGVTFDSDNNRAVGRTASTEEEILSFRGSKYIQAYTADTFKELVGKCQNQKFAIFGLSCQIYAIARYIESRKLRANHLLIDLYCHGCPTMNLWKKYCEYHLPAADNKEFSANFRSKVRGWGNFDISIQSTDKTEGKLTYISPKSGDEFFTLFFSDLVLNDACYDCKCRSTLEYTDIRLGDFWGHKFVSNHTGVSAVTICSEHGANIFGEIKDDIEFHEQEFTSFLPYQSYGKVYPCDRDLRRKLLEELADTETSIRCTVKRYKRSLPLSSRAKLALKDAIKLLPPSVVSSIKKSFYLMRK